MKYDFSDFDDKSQYDFSDFDDKVTSLESGLRGIAQGTTLGFADEISGGIESLVDIATTDKELSDLQDLYIQNRDESRSNFEKAQQANPGSYLAGEVGGGIATAFVPGLNTAKLGSLGAKVAANAGLGAAYGLGSSDADTAMGLAKDTALAGALGGGMTYGFEKAAPYIKKGFEKLGQGLSKADDFVTEKAGKALFGVDEKATQHYLGNKADVERAWSFGDLADSVLNTTDESSALRQMKRKISDMDTLAWNSLDDNKSISKNSILNAVADGQDSLLIDGKLIGKNQKTAFNQLESLLEDLRNFGDEIPESQLKSIIQNLDANTNWNNPDAGILNDKLKEIRVFVDSRLKDQNPLYASHMKNTEESVKALGDVQSVFQNRLHPENYDKFLKQTKNIINKDSSSMANKAVDQIKTHTGYDLRKDIMDSWTKSQFEKGDINGSRKTMLGTIIGSAAGSVAGPAGAVIGGAAGGAAGHVGDRYAGPLFKVLLNGKLNAADFTQKLAPKLGKFATPLMEAAKRGNNAVASVHFILQQNNPEYRQMINSMDEEK